jgi:hypothetical protein
MQVSTNRNRHLYIITYRVVYFMLGLIAGESYEQSDDGPLGLDPGYWGRWRKRGPRSKSKAAVLCSLFGQRRAHPVPRRVSLLEPERYFSGVGHTILGGREDRVFAIASGIPIGLAPSSAQAVRHGVGRCHGSRGRRRKTARVSSWHRAAGHQHPGSRASYERSRKSRCRTCVGSRSVSDEA